MKKGISPVISTVFLILITISATYIVMNVVKPTIDRAYEAGVMNEAEQNMRLLDNLIREVASEGRGSLRTVVLKVTDGNYKIINTSGNFTGALQFNIELKHSPFAAPMLKRVGNLKYTAGMNSVGLIGYWNLNERNGTKAEDSSGYGNHGTLYNGSSICSNPPSAGCPEWVEGKFGRALSFDGVDDYVSIPQSSFNFASDSAFTIATWVYFNGSGSERGIVSNGEGNARGWMLFWRGDSYYMYWRNSNGTQGDDLYFNANGYQNRWVHIVAIWNNGYKALYLNGSKVAQKSTSLTLGGYPTRDLYIGRKDSFSTIFNGTIDEVRIYNRALSEEEIKENYNAKASNYQIVLEYGKIVLMGNIRFSKGTHKICIEKIGELSNKPLIKIFFC
ncbi:MAG: LamG domain-containing protein [Candidatus Aenigmatarchaeota archaeon]